MQYRVPREILHEIGARTSIVETIGRYVSLQKRGRSYIGLCPFHDEKTPSFHVDAAKGMFYCFGCQTGGDVFHFLTKIENRGFMDVVRELAQRTGVELPERELTPRERQNQDERERLLHVLEVAAAFYERNRIGPGAAVANAYLKKRRISEEVAKDFRLGFAPDGWQNLIDHLRRHNHPVFLAEKAGLVMARSGDRGGYYDRFRGRIIFPIRNVSGKVVGFGGRVLDSGEPKYLNSPETPLFNKSETLFGLELARRAIAKEESAVVVEGNFDTISLHGAGVQNAVATCGTSLTRAHLKVLKRYTRRVVLVYDGDSAGLKAAERSLSLFLEEDLWPYFVPLPVGKDPDDVVREEGGEAFQARIRNAMPLFDHVVSRQARQAQASVHDRETALEALAPLFLIFARFKPERLDYYYSFVAQHFGMSESVVQDYFRRQQKAGRPQVQPKSAPKAPPALEPSLALPVHEEFLVHWILQKPEEIVPAAKQARIVDWLTHDGIRSVVSRAMAAFENGETLDVPAVMEEMSDPVLRGKLAEFCVKELAIEEKDKDKTALQSLLGIKEKNLNFLLKRVQGEITRLEREGSDMPQLARLLVQKTELNREQYRIQRRRNAGAL